MTIDQRANIAKLANLACLANLATPVYLIQQHRRSRGYVEAFGSASGGAVDGGDSGGGIAPGLGWALAFV